MNPLISIMIPVYNAERYLERCLESVLSQTYSNIEIVMVNDGSTDSSGEICNRYAESDDRIKVFHKTNEGVAATRNYLLSKVNGDYLMFVDSDDTIPNDAVSVMYERMVRDGSDMAVGRYLQIDELNGEAYSRGKKIDDNVLTSRETLELIGVSDFIYRGPCAKMYKRGLFEGLIYPNLLVGEDSWLYPHLVMRCKFVSCMAKNVYFYL